MSSSSAERAISWACAGVALAAVVARVHDVVAYPALYDFDASGHALNVIEILEGRLPSVRSWAGSHPPLYYAIGAALVTLLPDSVPIHVTLRLLSVGSWVATVVLVWRGLLRIVPAPDAAAVAVLLLGVPGLVIASCMMTNDVLCALLTTAVVVRLQRTTGPASARDVATTALLAGLSAMTKATGIAAVGVTMLVYPWRARARPAVAVRHLAIVTVTAALCIVPHYARLFSTLSGPAYEIVGTRAGSLEKEVIGHLVYAVAPTRHVSSFVALLHAALWGDPTGVYLPRDLGSAGAAVSACGALVVAVAAFGVLRLVTERGLVSRVAVSLLFGAVYAAALLPLVAYGPYLVLTKVNYMLPLALPVATIVALGLAWGRGAWRWTIRLALLVVTAAGVSLTWYGWWDPAPPPHAATLANGTAHPATRTVERYFALRAHDPVRTLRLLAPEVHGAHGLRLVRILRVPFTPESGLAPADEQTLELARARVAWLELYNLVRWLQPVASSLAVQVREARLGEEVAHVRVGIGAAGPAPAGAIGLWPFPELEQEFTLARASGTWKITAITQSGVVAENAVQAFAAAPTLGSLERLRALGWSPSWERAIAAALDAQR